MAKGKGKETPIRLLTLLQDIHPNYNHAFIHNYQLSEALGINKSDRYSNYPPKHSIVEMLDQWLKSSPQRRTWGDAADVLRRIGLQQVAVDIEQDYETSIC